MISWLEVFGKEVQLLVLAVRDDDTLRGIAPLCIRGGKVLTFIGYPQNDYADFLIDPATPEVLGEIVSTIFSLKGKWRKIILDQFRQENSQWQQIQGLLQKRRIPFRLELSDACPVMVLHDIAAAKKMFYKRNFNKYVNWFRQHGKFSYDVYTENHIAMQRLDDLFSQHISRWEGTATPSTFKTEEMRQFYRAFVGRMHPKRWVQLSSLTLDEKFPALCLVFEYYNILYLYKGCFNLEFNKKSPGQVILRYLFDYAVERSIIELDFTRGNEEYKDRFANAIRRNRRIIIYRSTLSRWMADMFHSFRYSKLVDILYRNKLVQKTKYQILRLYHGH